METLAWEIAETANALKRAFDRRATSLGVTRAQWRVLGRLARAPGQRQVEMAEAMDIEPITLCRIVDRLEDAGLVERRRDPDDRRAWQLFLLPAAEPVVEKLFTLAERMSAEAFKGLSDDDLDRIRADLGTIRTNIADQEKRTENARVTA